MQKKEKKKKRGFELSAHSQTGPNGPYQLTAFAQGCNPVPGLARSHHFLLGVIQLQRWSNSL